MIYSLRVQCRFSRFFAAARTRLRRGIERQVHEEGQGHVS